MTGVAPFGVLLLDKPEGPTSHDLVGWARWGLGVRQVGHCGTLDPAASGLLIVCVGTATRFVPFLTGVDKTYEARFVLGVSTDSADREGSVLERAPVDDAVVARVPAALDSLHGELQLAPPAFSAVKIDGQRAHRLARRGEAVELEPRPMTVHACSLTSIRRDESTVVMDATIEVSKGTYIRSLAVELGARLGVPAHLGGLRRVACGDLSLRGAAPVVRVEASQEDGRWRCHAGSDRAREAAADALRAGLLDPADVLPVPVVELTGTDDVDSRSPLTRLCQGQELRWSVDDLARLGLGRDPEPAPRVCVRARGADGRSAVLVIARLEAAGEPEEDGYRVRPERVVRAVSGSSKGPKKPLQRA
ncbi:MAG: tRNA pseudouridine(55) synthase TruB [Myxococcales bacterium]|nr:tRNA pseudouridine(55) synthase TruB [Myxococcales bacterium]